MAQVPREELKGDGMRLEAHHGHLAAQRQGGRYAHVAADIEHHVARDQ